MRAAFSNRAFVVDLLGGNVESALKTQLAQRVLGDIAVADTLPCTSVSALGLRAAVISFVAFILLALMHRTISPVRQVRTAGIGAGALGFSWHVSHLASLHKKSPAGLLPQGSRMFYFVHHNTIIRSDSHSLSFTLMMAATQESAVSCIR